MRARTLLLLWSALLFSDPARAQEPADPRFRDAAAETGLGGLAAYRVWLTDLDGDGLPEAVFQARDDRGPVNPGGTAHVFANVADPRAPGGRRFVEVHGAIPERAGGACAPDARHVGVFVVAGDVDNDGVVDLFRPVYQEQADHAEWPDTGERSAVLRGVGTAGQPRFEAFPAPGVDVDGAVTTCAAAFLDVNRDGNLDLFVGNWYVRFGTNLLAHPDRLFLGDGAGQFVDVTQEAGLMTRATVGQADSHRPTYGVSHTDFDGDGLPDLVTATYGRQFNRLWRQRPDGTFADWAPAVGFDGDADRSGAYPDWIKEDKRMAGKKTEPAFRANGNSFSAVPADFDNDGDVDLFLAEITHGWAGPSSDLSALLVNQGPAASPPFKLERVSAPFERPRRDRWWNQGDYLAAWADFDNDGRLDLALGSGAYPDDQRLRFYRQKPDHGFEDVTQAWGVDFRDCWSLSTDDVDGDGAVDLLVSGMPAEWNGRKGPALALLRNRPTPGAHWAEFVLEGRAGTRGPGGKPAAGANRAAIGARVWVTAGGVTQMREVLSSTGHFGLAPGRTLHWGLGVADRFDVRVEWPDRQRSTQEFKGLAADARYRLMQGESPRAMK